MPYTLQAPILTYSKRLSLAGGGLTTGVTGKGRAWREKPPDAESAAGTESLKVWATSALVRVHALLGGIDNCQENYAAKNCKKLPKINNHTPRIAKSRLSWFSCKNVAIAFKCQVIVANVCEIAK